MAKDNLRSEFGGDSGPIQPVPHEPTPAEQARLERAVDPADPNDSVANARGRMNGELDPLPRSTGPGAW